MTVAAIALDARAEVPPAKLTLVADLDDDDANGVADALSTKPSGAVLEDVHWLKGLTARTRLVRIEGNAVRAVADGKVLTPRGPLPARVGLQGLERGTARVVFSDRQIDVSVLELYAVDGRGERVDLARSHASLSRVLPGSLGTSEGAKKPDPDALHWYIAGPESDLPGRVRIRSRRPSGEPLDVLDDVPTSAVPCAFSTPSTVKCRRTPLIRATADVIDRSHPSSSGRSLRAEVGGTLEVQLNGGKAAAVRVGGPRKTRLGALDRYRGRLRVRVVRLSAGGSVPIGGDTQGALALAREEIRTASALWGQCGIHFGMSRDLDVQVVDPPPAHLLAVGCEQGLPATGGELAIRVLGRELRLRTRAGQTPTEVANALAEMLRHARFRAELSPNARTSPGAQRTVDVLVKNADGTPAAVEASVRAELSNDPTLRLCLGEVDLSDGLTHFTDFDAVAGTIEERSLIKAFDDGDPGTIEVFIVPSFARSGRIGESFIYSEGAGVRNVVILDRAGVRAGARSYALAHELGHILLDMPDHPDDFGVDQPESLMDADAADPTIFGPRRLSVSECERAIVQSGPGAPMPLLQDWPLRNK